MKDSFPFFPFFNSRWHLLEYFQKIESPIFCHSAKKLLSLNWKLALWNENCQKDNFLSELASPGMPRIFLRFDPFGLHLLQHIFYLVHTDTLFSRTFKQIFIFACFLMEMWTMDICEERSWSLNVPQSPVSWIITGTCKVPSSLFPWLFIIMCICSNLENT